MDENKFTNGFLGVLYRTSITLPYNYFKIYVNAMSSKIDEELEGYEKQLRDQRKKEGFFSTFLKSVMHEANKISMPKYFNNATFIFIYSKFEGDFKSICTVYQQQRQFKLSVSDLGGQNYIAKGKQYLEKCFGLDMSSLNTEWEIITKHQKVRNAITHNNSNIITQKERAVNKQELYPIIYNDSHFILDNDSGDFYIKDKKYILDFCDLANSYLSKTLELMDRTQKNKQ